ncbi:hypothetical protein JCM24511_01723 [Saitozyma sp. JCM 24511]|nr:hypothetical protein JCM24511_01723 [Saitozyma sp. JCM 24511]
MPLQPSPPTLAPAHLSAISAAPVPRRTPSGPLTAACSSSASSSAAAIATTTSPRAISSPRRIAMSEARRNAKLRANAMEGPFNSVNSRNTTALDLPICYRQYGRTGIPCHRPQTGLSLFCSWLLADGTRCINEVADPKCGRVCDEGYHRENARSSVIDDLLVIRRHHDAQEAALAEYERHQSLLAFDWQFPDLATSSLCALPVSESTTLCRPPSSSSSSSSSRSSSSPTVVSSATSTTTSPTPSRKQLEEEHKWVEFECERRWVEGWYREPSRGRSAEDEVEAEGR